MRLESQLSDGGAGPTQVMGADANHDHLPSPEHPLWHQVVGKAEMLERGPHSRHVVAAANE